MYRGLNTSTNTPHDIPLTVYTTRPDTIFGVDFMVVAPEHELIEKITTAEQKKAVHQRRKNISLADQPAVKKRKPRRCH